MASGCISWPERWYIYEAEMAILAALSNTLRTFDLSNKLGNVLTSDL